MADTEMTPQQKAAATKKAKAEKKAADAQSAPSGGVQGAAGTLPLSELLRGYHARRLSWAFGRVIYVGQKGGRGGAKPMLMMTGSRSGDLPWVRTDDADVLAEDWVVVDPAADVSVASE
jgi:hypothetical protein